ncbi:hypothetical protein V5739_03875 [Salinimicrobium sp. TIG7-5_MAKvit]
MDNRTPAYPNSKINILHRPQVTMVNLDFKGDTTGGIEELIHQNRKNLTR